MKLTDKEIKTIIKNNKFKGKGEIISYLKNNPDKMEINDLSRLAELANANRLKTAAYYTDTSTMSVIKENLPQIQKKIIKVLEPSVGVGNFIQLIIDRYSYAEKLIIDVNDIDETSIEITRVLNKYRNIPANVKINYTTSDFLLKEYNVNYDLIIGNPPFLKVHKQDCLGKYVEICHDNATRNTSGLFLSKALQLGERVILIMPKYFLSNSDFKNTRNQVLNYSIEKIIDFGERGFKGVLIETIAIFIAKNKDLNKTSIISVPRDVSIIQDQKRITNGEFPAWLIYRDDAFDELVPKMVFGIFNSYRDRQITNKILLSEGDIKVIRSRNIKRDGSGLVSIKNYDKYINTDDLENLSIAKFYKRDDVFLAPNMTYYPRVIRKPKNTIVNGSVAILENISKYQIEDNHLKFFSSDEFEMFYRIARKQSILFCGYLAL